MRDFAAPMAYSSLFFGTKAVAFANTYELCTLRLKRSRHHFFFHARNFFKKSLIV